MTYFASVIRGYLDEDPNVLYHNKVFVSSSSDKDIALLQIAKLIEKEMGIPYSEKSVDSIFHDEFCFFCDTPNGTIINENIDIDEDFDFDEFLAFLLVVKYNGDPLPLEVVTIYRDNARPGFNEVHYKFNDDFSLLQKWINEYKTSKKVACHE